MLRRVAVKVYNMYHSCVFFCPGTSDFFGLNHYSSRLASRLAPTGPKENVPLLAQGMQLMDVQEDIDPTWKRFDS